MTQIMYCDCDDISEVDSEIRVDRLYNALLAMEDEDDA